jgi:hypothetical protein
MAYTQPKGQGSPAAKTGAGIPSALTMTGSPAYQEKSIIDADGDGDTVFNDKNNDGTMASRAAKSLLSAGKKIGKAIKEDLFDGGAERKRKMRISRGNINTKSLD